MSGCACSFHHIQRTRHTPQGAVNYCIHFEPNRDKTKCIRKNAIKGLKQFSQRMPQWCLNTPANRARLRREKDELQIRSLSNRDLKAILNDRGETITGSKADLQRRVIAGLPPTPDDEDSVVAETDQAWLLDGIVLRRHSQIGPGIRYSTSQLNQMWVGDPQISTCVHVVQPATKAGGSDCKDANMTTLPRKFVKRSRYGSVCICFMYTKS